MSNVQEALKQAIEALEYHTEQTRPIQKTIDTLALCKAALAEIEKCEPVAEAIRERDRLGFAVVNVIGKLDEIIENTQEVEVDDFLHIAVPVDMWNELQAELEYMPKRADLYTSPQPIEKCEPVAYALMSIRGKPHKLSMTKSSCLKKQEAWQKEWPNNGSYIAKLYDKPQPREKCEPTLFGVGEGTEVYTAEDKAKAECSRFNKPLIRYFTSPQPRELYAGDCVAYLYKDNNGGLKICNESPPPDKSFPVFITNLSFLDVARTVLEDCSDLIIKQGSVNLWKELSAKINRDYKQLNTKG